MRLILGLAVALLAAPRIRARAQRPGSATERDQSAPARGATRVLTVRAALAFQPLDAADGAKWWLDKLYANWEGMSAERRRITVRILVAAAAYELLNRAAIERITIGPVAIRDLTLVQAVLPAVVAHQLMQTAVVRFWMVGYDLTALAGLRALQPTISEYRLNGVATPYRVVLDEPMSPGPRSTAALSRLTFVLHTVQTVILRVAPLAFLVYAYLQLHDRGGFSYTINALSTAHWGSLLAATAFVGRGVIFDLALALQVPENVGSGAESDKRDNAPPAPAS